MILVLFVYLEEVFVPTEYNELQFSSGFIAAKLCRALNHLLTPSEVHELRYFA